MYRGAPSPAHVHNPQSSVEPPASRSGTIVWGFSGPSSKNILGELNYPEPLAVRPRTADAMPEHPSYLKVFLTFARNSLIRDMTFRTNFLLESISSASWTLMNVGFYLLVFRHTRFIGVETGWGKCQFFVFLATTWFVNSKIGRAHV